MKWFHDLPIARKLAVGFTLTTLMTVILGAFALVRLNGANAELGAMASNDIPSVQHLGEVRSQLGEFRTYEMAQVSMFDQPEKVADYNKRMETTAKVVRDELAAYAALPAGERERALFAKVSADTDAYFAANVELRAAVAAGDGALARQVSDEKSRPARRQLFDDLKALGAFSNGLMASKIAAANATHRTSVIAIISCMVLLSLVAAALAFMISRIITRPLGQAVHAIKSVARGDLSVTTRATSADEAGQMLAATGEMTSMLRRYSEETRQMAAMHAGPDISHRMPTDFRASTVSWPWAPTRWCSTTWMRSRTPSPC